MKKCLAYSPLTDQVYYLDGKGQKVELPKGNFIQMVLLWVHELESPKMGTTVIRTLKGQEGNFDIKCKHYKDGK